MPDPIPAAGFAYDEVAYPTPIVPEMYPGRIRAAGLLTGMAFPLVPDADVLEIGCGDGFNLLGIAAASSGGQHVGFDLAAAAIARGQAVLQASALPNAELSQGDITSWRRPGQAFDYILCHGVHTWVPEPVQDALLALIAAQLKPGGVAYLSHDVLPAASAKQQIKSFLGRALPPGLPPADAIAAAKILLRDVASAQLPQSRLKPQFDILLRELAGFEDGYFFHDWLSAAYHPVSMLDLAASAAAHGLAVIGDAGLIDGLAGDGDPLLSRLSAQIGGGAAARAYALDMLSGARMFRRTLLTLAASPPASTTSLDGLSLALSATPETHPSGGEVYKGEDGAFLRPADAAEAQVMALLARAAPGEVACAALSEVVGDPVRLRQILLKICSVPVAHAFAAPPVFVTQPGERPVASALARVMLAKAAFAPTLRLNRLATRQGATSTFLGLCDGTRTRADLQRDMSARLGRAVQGRARGAGGLRGPDRNGPGRPCRPSGFP